MGTGTIAQWISDTTADDANENAVVSLINVGVANADASPTPGVGDVGLQLSISFDGTGSFSIAATEPGSVVGTLTPGFSIIYPAGGPTGWLTEIGDLTPVVGNTAQWTLLLSPTADLAGDAELLVSVANSVSGLPPSSGSAPPLEITVVPVNLPVFMGLGSTVSCPINGLIGVPFSVSDLNPAQTITFVGVRNTSQPWLSASVTGTPGSETLAVKASEFGKGTIDVEAIDASGQAWDILVSVTVAAFDSTASDSFTVEYPPGTDSFGVEGGAPPFIAGGTVEITSGNSGTAAARAGYTTLQFNTVGWTYYTNGVPSTQVQNSSEPEADWPIVLVQNANNRGLAYVYLNQYFDARATDSATFTIQPIDAAGMAAAPFTINLQGVVNDATLAVVNGGNGTSTALFSQSGGTATLNLGSVALNGTPLTGTIDVSNAASGQSDQLLTSFLVSNDGAFINSGIATTYTLGTGASQAIPFTLAATQAGMFTETITVLATGTNVSGYAASLAGEVLTVTGTVVAPRTMTWNGGAATDFGTAANWNDLTNGQSPAQTPPDSQDTVLFDTSDGAISGTGTVAAVDVGTADAGVLELSGGSTLVAGALDVGVASGADGQVGLTGAGTDLTIGGTAVVADDGTGILSVLSGATFTAAGLTVGSQGQSSGALVVSGAGSTVRLSGALNIGTALGTGDLTVGPGAAVQASVVNLQGQVVLEGGLLDPTVSVIDQGQTAGGFGTLAAGDIIDEGVIQASGSAPSRNLLLVRGTVLGGGSLSVNGTAQPSPSVGWLQIDAGDTMELTGPVLNAAVAAFSDMLTPTGTYSVGNSVIDVTFADAGGVLLLDDIAGFAGTITSFKAGDQFVIAGGTLYDPSVANGNTLAFLDSGPNAGIGDVDQIIFGSSVIAGQFDIVNGNTVQAVSCFAAGTRIMTEDGAIAVERLRVGDRVLTACGRIEPVVWLGSRTVNCRKHPAPETVWPVRMNAGAFGKNVPLRDLYLSPDHAVFVNNILVPVKLLANGNSIAQVKRASSIYYHVELPRHEVILAEGLPVESYLDTGDRMSFNPGGDIIRLFPDFAARFAPEIASVWETRGAAPLVMTGVELDAARGMVIESVPPRRGKPSFESAAEQAMRMVGTIPAGRPGRRRDLVSSQ